MAINKRNFELTQEGLDELKKELEHLKTVARQENLEALKEARAQGDLSENADYDSAREEQARIESRILEIDNIIKNAKIIKKDSTDTITTGKEVTLKFIERNTEAVYNLVGTIEADPLNGKISIDSPIGKAIRGRRVGDIATVKSETGKEFTVEVLHLK